MQGRFDIAITGGGLAGLSAAIMLARKGYSVALFEKSAYPIHRVCGEYISMESWDFLKSLGLPLDQMELPRIKKLRLTLPDGKETFTPLAPGGFGMSRYTLDYELANIAHESGVDIWEKTTVTDITFKHDAHIIQTTQGTFSAKVAIGAFGKRSGLDKKFKRKFALKSLSPEKNFIAVKYHMQGDLPRDLIELHIFRNGYCGILKVNGTNRYCLCYLTTAKNLQEHNGDIRAMERTLLAENKTLKRYFDCFASYYTSPLVISQISFDKKEAVTDHVLTLGDAAGFLPPLCGNGMSMAFNSAYMVIPMVEAFLDGKISRRQMEDDYKRCRKKKFSLRVRAGNLIQQLLFKPAFSSALVSLFNCFPFLLRQLLQLTHGRPFYQGEAGEFEKKESAKVA